jgi:hypothetical protein
MVVAKIESTFLGTEDHGCFTAWLMLNFEGSGQGAGGYILDTKASEDRTDYKRRGTAMGLDFIMQIIKTLGVNDWEHLKGVTIYALKEEGKSWDTVKGIAQLHDPENRHFVFQNHFDKFRAEFGEIK